MLSLIAELFQFVSVFFYLVGGAILLAVLYFAPGWKGKLLGGAIVFSVLELAPLLLQWGTQQKENVLVARNKAMNVQFTKRCTENAGISIRRVVEKVDGVFIMNPRNASNTNNLEGQFPLGDMYGLSADNSTEPGRLLEGSSHTFEGQPRAQPLLGFDFVEMPNPERETNHSAAPYIRITLDQSKSKANYTQTITEPVQRRRGRYGFDWTDISTSEDRQHWIAGGKTRIVDLETNEVIAERTGFVVSRMRDERVGGGVWSVEIGNVYCPKFENEDYKTLEFLASVLTSTKVVQSGKASSSTATSANGGDGSSDLHYVAISNGFSGAIQHFEFAGGVSFDSFDALYAAINKPKYNRQGSRQVGGRLSDDRLEGAVSRNGPVSGNAGIWRHDGVWA